MKKLFGIVTALILCALMISQTMAAFAVPDNSIDLSPGNEVQDAELSRDDLPEVNTKSYTSDKAETPDYAEGEAIVMLKKSAPGKYMSKSKAASVYGKGIKMESSFDAKSKNGDKDIKGVCVKSNTKTTKELIAELKNDPSVDCVFPNYYMEPQDITNDPYSGYQWALDNTGQNGGTSGIDINANALWSKADSSSSGEQVVAVIDSGIDAAHEDLKNVLWKNTTDLPGTYGYDYVNDDAVPEDATGHGTHIAGIIAASANNSKGISGINTSKTKIMAFKVDVDEHTFNTDAIFSSLDYISKAIDKGVNVVAVNCSFGKSNQSDEYKAVMENWMNVLGQKGAVTCVSAGNNSEDMNSYHDETGRWWVPACCDSDYKICVAASDENDGLAYFSNYGDKYVDVAAPGTNILSTVPESEFIPTIYTPSQRQSLCTCFQDYSSFSDTSSFGLNYTAYAFDGYSLKITSGGSDSFGKTKGSMKIESADGNYGSGIDFYIEFPYSVDNKTDKYYFSYKRKSYADMNARTLDADANYATESKFYQLTGFGNIKGDSYRWFTDYSNSDPQYIYNFTTSRKFIMCFKNVTGPIIIDEFGISKQGVSESSFGKYDYMQGTSMACPHVTGAVALLRSAYPSYSVIDIVNMIKTTGRQSAQLTNGLVKNGFSLSLDKTSAYTQGSSSIPKITGLQKTSATTTSATLKWDSLYYSDIKYVIEKKTSSTNWTPYNATTLNPAKLSNLEKSTTYYFRVRALVNGIYGGYSNTITVTTPSQDITVPAVTGLKVDDITKNSVLLSWDSVDISGVKYQYFYKKSTDESWNNGSVNSAAINVGGLSPDTTYYFAVRAYYEDKYGGYSSTISAKTKKAVPAVTGLTATGTSEDSVSLSWDPVEISGAQYVVDYRTDYDSWQTTGLLSSTEKTVYGLQSDTTYYFRVSAYYDGEYGAYSNELTVRTDSEATQPTQPPQTTIKIKAAKTTIYVGESTTVKATVTNPVGTTTFKSGNTKLATVSSAGKVVGKAAGTVTISAKNNGKVASVKIKVIKRTNPITVKTKTISLKKGYKTKKYAKAKAFTVKNAKGTVVFKKASGNGKITVASSGTVTVKKGLKKGTYKVKVKVTAKGNTTYNSKSKTVTLTVKVK